MPVRAKLPNPMGVARVENVELPWKYPVEITLGCNSYQRETVRSLQRILSTVL